MSDIIETIGLNGMNLNGVVSKLNLTEKRRTALMNSLSSVQKNVLIILRQYQMKSIFLNEINTSNYDWKIIEEKINLSFDQSRPQKSPLKCECGRGVKFLYICKSDSTNSILKLGRTHLENQTDLSVKIIKQVINGEHKIDQGIDEILKQVELGEFFPEQDFSVLEVDNRSILDKIFSKKKLNYINKFREVNLPIYEADKLTIVQKAAEFRVDEMKKEEIRNREEFLNTTEGQEIIKSEREKRAKEKVETEKYNVRRITEKRLMNSYHGKSEVEKSNVTMNRAKETFDSVFEKHKYVLRKYDFNKNNALLVLTIWEIFKMGDSIPGKYIAPMSTVIKTVSGLSQMYGYDISSGQLNYEYNNIMEILVAEEILIDGRNGLLSNY